MAGSSLFWPGCLGPNPRISDRYRFTISKKSDLNTAIELPIKILNLFQLYPTLIDLNTYLLRLNFNILVSRIASRFNI